VEIYKPDGDSVMTEGFKSSFIIQETQSECVN